MLINPYLFVAAAGGFTPADLFASGEAGLYSIVNATTTATTVGNKAAQLSDLSGNGKTLTQTTEAKKPILQNDGTNDYLLWDGSDDVMNFPEIKATASNWTFIIAMRDDTGTSLRYIMDAKTGRLVLASKASTNNNIGYFDGSWKETPYTYGTNRVITFELVSGGSARIRSNGADILTGQAYTQKAIGADTFLFAAGTTQNIGGRLYNIILIDRVLTAGELADAEQWSADNSGVTL